VRQESEGTTEREVGTKAWALQAKKTGEQEGGKQAELGLGSGGVGTLAYLAKLQIVVKQRGLGLIFQNHGENSAVSASWLLHRVEYLAIVEFGVMYSLDWFEMREVRTAGPKEEEEKTEQATAPFGWARRNSQIFSVFSLIR